MSKYIDTEAFKKRILSYGIVHEGDRIPIPYYKPFFAEAYVAMLRWVCEEVDDTPAADVKEVRYGRWIWKGEEGDSRFMCSVCHCKEYVPTCNGEPTIWEYCPNCGSRIDLEGEEE